MGTRLGELVERFGGRLVGDPDLRVDGIAPLERAGAAELSFLGNSKWRARAAQSRAAALILAPADDEAVASAYSGARILTSNPGAYFARSAQLLLAQCAAAPAAGIHPGAVVHDSAQVDPSAHIGPHATIEAGAVIKAGARIEAACYIGREAVVGEGTHFFPKVTFHARCVIGARLGMAGSTRVGRHCTFGGAAMINGHIEIADNVHITAGTLVAASITAPGRYTGYYPIAPNAEWERNAAILRKLSSYRERIRALEKAVQAGLQNT